MNNKKVFMPVLGVACAGLLVACGGGGGGGSTTSTTTLRGVFNDSPVDGLAYSCAPSGQSGTTSAGGQFNYVEGDACTFSLGAVVLGTAEAGEIVSPIELVTDGTPTNATVLNIVQLLLTADDDGNPSNGINITEGVAAAASTATTIDVSSGTFDVDVTQLVAAMNAAGSASATLVVEADAQSHIEGTATCIYSGLYNGTWNNGVGSSGEWGMIIFPDGTAQGIAEDNSLIGDNLTGEGDFSGTIDPSTISLTVSGTYYSYNDTETLVSTDSVSAIGRPTSPQTVAGTVGSAQSGQIGSFSGTRFAGDAMAKYRYTGYFSGNLGSTGVFAVDVYADNSVSGKAYHFGDNSTYTLSGSVSAGTLSMNVSGGATATAAIDLANGTITSATWASDVESGTFSGSGCQLN